MNLPFFECLPVDFFLTDNRMGGEKMGVIFCDGWSALACYYALWMLNDVYDMTPEQRADVSAMIVAASRAAKAGGYVLDDPSPLLPTRSAEERQTAET